MARVSDAAIPMLILSGSIGAGKTTLLGEVSDVLIDRGSAFTSIDIDAVTQVFPRSEGDPFGMLLAARNLRAIWENARAAGAERLVLASVIESRDDLEPIVAAVPDADPFVVLLEAPDEILQERVRRREIGSALGWHLERSRELAGNLRASGVADAVVQSDDRPIRAIAEEILAAAGW